MAFQPDGEQEGRGGNERHHQESRKRPEEFKVINGAARKGDGIKNHHARRA